MLVVHLGHDDLGCSSLSGKGGGARATVVYYSGDPSEERPQVNFPDGKTVGLAVRECHAGPPARYDCPAAGRARGLDDGLAHVPWSAHTAEAEVNGWLAGVEERLQLQGQLPLVRTDPGAGLDHIQVRGLRPWRQRRVGGQPWPAGEDVAPHVGDRR